MKKLFIILACVISPGMLLAQEPDTTKPEESIKPATVQIEDENGTTTFEAEDVDVKSGDAKKDTVRIKIGKKAFAITEDETGTSVKVEDLDDMDNWEEDEEEVFEDQEEMNGDEEHAKRKKMDGHWSGFSFGLNNFLTSDYSMSLPADAQFMDLNTGRSWNFNINFLEHSFGFGTDMVGLVTGMGFSFNNYHFDGNTSIEKDPITREIVPTAEYAGVEKNKLSTTYLNVPLLLEFQFPNINKDKRAYISAGVVGGIKTGSHTKIEYRDGSKQKDKIRDDFNISPLRYGFTARIGYRGLNLYGNYYPVPLFESGKGPELYPFDLGINLSF